MSVEPVSHRFRSQTLDLHYVEWGDRDRPTLILQHGGNDHARSWDRLARALSDRFRVVAPDLRGHGDSGWSSDGNYSVNACVYDLRALYRALGVETAAIIGHSFGGMVASRYAGLYPETVRHMVVIEGLGLSRGWVETWLATPVEQRLLAYFEQIDTALATEARPYARIEDVAARLRAHNPRLSSELALHLAGHATRLGPDGMLRWKFDLRFRARAPIDLSTEERRRLRWRIDAPVLLIDGSESPLAGPAEAYTEFRDARRLLVEGAGHWVQHDGFDEVAAACREFLGA